jgi:hypothetical protein
VHSAKKLWVKPAIERVELSRARALIVKAIETLGDDYPESEELRSILEDIDAKLATH